MSILSIEVKPLWGADIRDTIDEAKKLSALVCVPIRFLFNQSIVTVDADSDVNEVYADYRRQFREWLEK